MLSSEQVENIASHFMFDTFDIQYLSLHKLLFLQFKTFA